MTSDRSGKDSWYERLSGVASSLMVQWILILNGFSPPGGAPAEATRATCRSLLMHVPTPPTSDKTYPHFHVDIQSLEDAMLLAEGEDKEEVPTRSEIVIAELNQDIDAVADALAQLDPDVLSETIYNAEKTTSEMNIAWQNIVATMSETPFQDSELSVKLRDATRVEPAMSQSLEITPTDWALFNGNTATKMAIIMALGQQELEGWQMLAASCAKRVAEWDQKLTELQRIQSAMLQMREQYSKFRDGAGKKEDVISTMERLVTSAIKSHPYAGVILEREKKRSYTPFSPIPNVPPKQGDATPNSMGNAQFLFAIFSSRS